MKVSANIREALLHVVKNLPAAPAILAELGRMLLDADADLADVIELLKRDPALTARIIRLANSVLYGAAGRIGSLEEALARVGYNEVYRLAGMAAVAEIAGQQLPLYGITAVQFRENSVLTALIIDRLAGTTGVAANLAYTAGLLRSVGKLALDRVAPASLQRQSYGNDEHGPVAAWERVHLGLSNCEAAALVLENWRFPRLTVQAVGDQYLTGGRGNSLALLLHLAASAAERSGHGLPGEQSYWSVTVEKLAAAGVDEGAWMDATRGALEAFGPIRAALGWEAGKICR